MAANGAKSIADDRAEVGERLRQIEAVAGLGGNALARALGIPHQTWSGYKTGGIELSFDVARKLKQRYG